MMKSIVVYIIVASLHDVKKRRYSCSAFVSTIIINITYQLTLTSDVPITPSPLVSITINNIRTNKHELSATGDDGATLVASSSSAVVVHQQQHPINLLLLPLHQPPKECW